MLQVSSLDTINEANDDYIIHAKIRHEVEEL
jgi:hypothetical protein